jgi:hypothetical protein
MTYYDQPRTSLVIPDAHVGPDQDLTRFEKLGRLIVDRKPDRLITLGDWVSLDSMSAWDLDAPGRMENKRYYEDIAAGRAAIELTVGPLRELQEKQRKNKEKIYKPQQVFIKGNHCNRSDRYLEKHPELRQHVDVVRDLKLIESGFTDIVEYKDMIEIDGVLFTHVPMNGAAQPLSGKYGIHRAAEIMHKSLVYAHHHRRENVNFFRHGADSIIQVLTAGAFFDHTESYSYGGALAYWPGLLILSHWAEGRFDVEEISLERLYQLY